MGRKRPLTKNDWLEKAMELLRARGIEGVRVLSLARSLGVTRGSFYWHFRNRQDLLDSMLDWWDRAMTDSVIEAIGSLDVEGRALLDALVEDVVRNRRSGYDTAIHAWAEHDPRAAEVVRRVMRKRLEVVEGLFREAGFSAAEARAWARKVSRKARKMARHVPRFDGRGRARM